MARGAAFRLRLLRAEWTPGASRAALGFGLIVVFIALTHYAGFLLAVALLLPLFLWRIAKASLRQCVLESIVVFVALVLLARYSSMAIPSGVWIDLPTGWA
jgi:hypothetical protein